MGLKLAIEHDQSFKRMGLTSSLSSIDQGRLIETSSLLEEAVS